MWGECQNKTQNKTQYKNKETKHKTKKLKSGGKWKQNKTNKQKTPKKCVKILKVKIRNRGGGGGVKQKQNNTKLQQT